jgi:hypothetical protein
MGGGMTHGFPSFPIDVIDARSQGIGINGIYGQGPGGCLAISKSPSHG